MNEILLTILSIFIVVIIAALILIKPYFGIIFTLTSLPIVDLLPEIPFLSSIVVLIGAFTIIGFLGQKKVQGNRKFSFGNIHVIGLVFVGWIFISHPDAAWFGLTRNWFLTFFQLWVLIWLTGELLDSPQKQHIFMWTFSLVSAISAFIAVQQGRIGETIGESYRTGALAGQPNSSARYFVLSMIFFSYLRSITKKPFLRLLASVGMIVTFLGVFFTLSRTGMLLLIAAVGLQIILNSRKKSVIPIILVYLSAALILFTLSDNIFAIVKSILPSIELGTDTIGLRYQLWDAAWKMWLDHILQGVGIGMYPANLHFYAPNLPSRYWSLGAHNTYLMVLSETGLIGFGLFLSMLFFSLRNFLYPGKNLDIYSIALRKVWLTAFLITLIGGITLNGQNDKMLWFLMGISIIFQRQLSRRTYSKSAQSTSREISEEISPIH